MCKVPEYDCLVIAVDQYSQFEIYDYVNMIIHPVS